MGAWNELHEEEGKTKRWNTTAVVRTAEEALKGVVKSRRQGEIGGPVNVNHRKSGKN